jgi:hypothetical protein
VELCAQCSFDELQLRSLKNTDRGWGCSSVVKGLLSICKALGSISTTSKKTKQKKKQPDLKFILSKTKVIMFYSVVFQVMLANKQYWKPPYQMISELGSPLPCSGRMFGASCSSLLLSIRWTQLKAIGLKLRIIFFLFQTIYLWFF